MTDDFGILESERRARHEKRRSVLIGDKHDKGKLRWDLLDLKLIEPVVDVLTYGAKKYEADSWKHVPEGKNRYYAALMRHLTEWRSGKKIDQESGKRHLWMAMCNLYFLIWFDKNP